MGNSLINHPCWVPPWLWKPHEKRGLRICRRAAVDPLPRPPVPRRRSAPPCPRSASSRHRPRRPASVARSACCLDVWAISGGVGWERQQKKGDKVVWPTQRIELDLKWFKYLKWGKSRRWVLEVWVLMYIVSWMGRQQPNNRAVKWGTHQARNRSAGKCPSWMCGI